ncbi:hypothetical protein [Caenispirillum salinarum]|uniref:hypothetical protein n=1 Tax=Caenispirillum salinarum TaxID=859058 RepID=UPI003850D619
MRIRFTTLAAPAAAALMLAACSPAAHQQADVRGTAGPPGSIETRDTWAPGYQYDVDEGKYYRIRPASEAPAEE